MEPINSTERLKGRPMHRNTQIIGLTGQARCGKDTIGKILANIVGFRMYSMAGPLKEMLFHGLGLQDKEDEKAKELYGQSYRYLAQTLGTEWGRDIVHPDLWILIAQQRIANSHVVITDIRFENEAEWVRNNGVLVHIVRQDQEIISENGHRSEDGIAMANNDFLIFNNKPIEEMKIELADVAKNLIKYLNNMNREIQHDT